MRANQNVKRTVLQGLMAGVAVMVLVAWATPASAAQSKANAKTGGKVDIMLMQPTQPKSGDNTIEVMVKGADGKPLSDADVSVLFVMPAMPAMKMPEMRNEVKLKAAGDGKYTGSGNIGMAGKWNTTITVKKDGKQIGQKKLTVTAK
jgi:hypothetical protein